MAITQRMTLKVLGACVVLLVSSGHAARIAATRKISSDATKSLTESETQTSAGGCSKIMARNLCKDYRNFIIEGLQDMQQEDLACISSLCTKYKNKCCKTITDLKNTMAGQTPKALKIDTASFNRLSALTGGETVEEVAKTKTEAWKAKPTDAPKKVEVETKMPEPKPWAAKLGWDLDANGKFHYSSGGEKLADDVVPTGCHEYAHVDYCFSSKAGDAWVLGKTRNMDEAQLQCVGYLCKVYNNEKCCGTLLGIKAAINGKNWMDLAEFEANFDKMMLATGEYLE